MRTTPPLHRYRVNQAAAELGTSAVTLRMRLKSRGIEADSPEGFTLAQIVRAMTDEGGGNVKERSLQAHAELQQHQAALARLKLSRENGELIERDGAMRFMAGLVKTYYDCLFHLSWPARQEEVEKLLQTEGIEFFARNGWQLEPETVFRQNGNRPPVSRREKWASALCSWVAQSLEAGHGRDTTGFGRRAGTKPGRARNISARFKKRRAVDSA